MSDAAQVSKLVPIPRGAKLSGVALSSVTAARPCKIVVVGGEPGAGKTTLLTSIYEQFRRGPFAGLTFAGSRTLPAFEQLCHPGRVASGRSEADTDRTAISDQPEFLHLSLRAGASRRTDLLLADISGEDFIAARDSQDDARRLDVITGAAHFSLLIDGEALGEPRTRHSVAANSKQLLRSLVEAGVLHSRSRCDVLITKIDTINTNQTATRYADRLITDIREQFEPSFAELTSFKVAARPENGGAAVNLDAVLQRWCEHRPQTRRHFTTDLGTVRSPYDRFVPIEGER